MGADTRLSKVKVLCERAGGWRRICWRYATEWEARDIGVNIYHCTELTIDSVGIAARHDDYSPKIRTDSEVLRGRPWFKVVST